MFPVRAVLKKLYFLLGWLNLHFFAEISATILDYIADTIDQYGGFSASSARQNQQWPLRVIYRLSLPRVHALKFPVNNSPAQLQKLRLIFRQDLHIPFAVILFHGKRGTSQAVPLFVSDPILTKQAQQHPGRHSGTNDARHIGTHGVHEKEVSGILLLPYLL